MRTWSEWLLEAVSDGHLELCKICIQNGADPNYNAKPTGADTPAMRSMRYGVGLDVAHYLFDQGADFSFTGADGTSVMLSLANKITKDNKQYLPLLEKVRDKALTTSGYGPLLDEAIRSNDVEAYFSLLDKGAQYDEAKEWCFNMAIKDDRGWSIDMSVVMRLLQHGVPVDLIKVSKDSSREKSKTLLDIISYKDGYKKEIKDLVQYGADPIGGPLNYAISSSWNAGITLMQKSVLKKISAKNFKIDVPLVCGKNFLEAFLDCSDMDKNMPKGDTPIADIVSKLILSGSLSDPNGKCSNSEDSKRNYLWVAAMKGKWRVVNDLLSIGANPFDERCSDLLECAAAHKSPEAFQALKTLQAMGMDVNRSTKWSDYFRTPLREAITSGSTESVEFLLDHGAKPSYENLRSAVHRNDPEKVGLLIKHGVKPDDAILKWEHELPKAALLRLLVDAGMPASAVCNGDRDPLSLGTSKMVEKDNGYPIRKTPRDIAAIAESCTVLASASKEILNVNDHLLRVVSRLSYYTSDWISGDPLQVCSNLIELARVLVMKGGDLNAPSTEKSKTGETLSIIDKFHDCELKERLVSVIHASVESQILSEVNPNPLPARTRKI